MKIFLISIILLIPLTVQATDENIDSDGDGLLNWQEESIYFTNPNNTDTDGDGHTDGLEIKNNFSPRHGQNKKLIQVDSDKDYLNDYWELILGTGLMNPDSDGDLFLDGTEVAASYNPLNPSFTQVKKLIKVNLMAQRLDYFFDNKLFGSFPISSGVARMPTPSGEFKVLTKFPVVHYAGSNYDYPNTKWNLHFTTQKYRFYIHGAYWHNNFGHPMSHGCVNVSYENMEPLYWWAQLGTKIIIE